MSQTSVKILFGAPQQQTDNSKISMVLHLQKQQTQKLQQQLSKATGKYRVPFLVVQTPQAFRQFHFELASKILEQEITFQKISNKNKAYHMYEPNKLQILAPLRKIQNLLEKLNTLQNKCYMNLTLCNFDAAIQKKTGLALGFLQNLLFEAKLDLDQNFVKLASQLIAKISPEFDQSPIIGFLQLFGGAEINLEFQSPAVLSNATRESVLPNQFELRSLEEGKKGQILAEMLKDKQLMKVYLNFGKLGSMQFTAETRFWAFLTLVL